MKLLATADLHIGQLTAYSTLDIYGVPSRTRAFLQLGDDLATLAKDRQVDAIVVAGDVTNAATMPPVAHWALQGFFDKLCSVGLPVIITHGQHDLDTKSLTHSLMHSVLVTIAGKHPNLSYAWQPLLGDVKDATVFVRPWSQGEVDHDKLQAADVFVGHGLVRGATDPFGYTFQHGFDADRLLERYKLSIIGDIHHGQILKRTVADAGDRVVLIPGAPIQTNWKDDPNCGVWICDVDSGVRAEFVPIYTLSDDNSYHRFLWVDDKYDPGSDLPSVHVKRRRVTEAKSPTMTGSVAIDQEHDVLASALLALGESKFDDPMAAKQALIDCYAKLPPPSVSVPAVQQLLRLEVDNFMSVDHVEIDFERWTGELLFVGGNGTGKTTLAGEAFLFLLTGTTTKPLTLTELYRDGCKTPFRLVGTLRLGDDIYRITRSRDSGPILSLEQVLSSGEAVLFRKGSVADTQQLIYQMLGIGTDEIRLLAYFSVVDLKTFGGMGPSDRLDMLGRFASVDRLDALRAVCDNELTTANGALAMPSAQLGMCRSQLSEHETKLARRRSQLSALSRTVIDAQAAALLEYRPEAAQALTSMQLANALAASEQRLRQQYDQPLKEEYDMLVEAHNTLGGVVTTCEDSLHNAQQTLEKAAVELRSVELGICPLCKQKVADKQLREQLATAVVTATDKATIANGMLAAARTKRKLVEQQRDDAHERNRRNVEIMVTLEQLGQLRAQLDNYVRSSDASAIEVEIRLLEQQLAERTIQAKQLAADIALLEKRRDMFKFVVTKLLARSGPVAARMTARACKLLEDEANALVGDSQVFTLRVEAGEKPKLRASFDGGRIGDINGMSGGERRLTDIIIAVALSNLFADRYGLKQGLLGLAVYDELFQYLEPKYTDVGYQVLTQGRARLKLVITHDDSLIANFSQIVRVTKENGVSHYAFP